MVVLTSSTTVSHRTSLGPIKWDSLLNRRAHPLKGHAGAVVQARQLGNELYVGVHSDEAILENKGPTVMTLEERYVPTGDPTGASAAS